eukprot:s6446_g3.t1
MNVGRGAIAKGAATLAAFHTSGLDVDVAALQEVDIDTVSADAFVQDWKSRGFYATLSPFVQGIARAAVISRVPCRSVSFHGLIAHDRVCAGILDLPDCHAYHKLVFVAFYGKVDDIDFSVQLLRSVVAQLVELGLPFLILGDFNALLSDLEGSGLLDSGVVMPMDLPFGHDLQGTRRGSARRIDFGLCSNHVFPVSLQHSDGVADHYGVLYALDLTLDFDRYRSPCRRELRDDSYETVASRFDSCWSGELFRQALREGNVDSAWTLLSDAAEQALAVGGCQGGAVSRSQRWQPVQNRALHRAAKSFESVRLSRLRRLYRRVVQSVKQPHDVALRQRCLRDLVTLKRCTPSLPLACTPSVALAEAVQQVVLEVEVEEKQARLKAWKSELRGSEARQVAWVRRRVRRERAAQAPLEKLPAACRMATHPARGVVEQQKVWSGVWSTPAPPVAEVNSMLRALEAHRPSQQTVHIDWSGEALFRLAKSMKCRASGPDDWSASTLTLLPLSWWSEYALLWQQVWSCSKVPSCWRDAKVALLAKEDGSGYRPLSVASVLWRIGAKHVARSLRLWAFEWSDQHVFGGIVGRAAKDAVARCIVAAELDPQATFVAQDLSRFLRLCCP